MFNKYDKNKLGYIRVQKIIEVFVKVGQNPSKNLEQTLLTQAYKQGALLFYLFAINLATLNNSLKYILIHFL